jgi:3-oxoadipate enol-lactonase
MFHVEATRSTLSEIAVKTTRNGRFSYEEAGAADLSPLVFLHGIGGAARAWRPQLQAFGGRFRAIAWDMPGYAGSAALPNVSIAELANALASFLRECDVRQPCIVGHSIGGMIVQQLLAETPGIAQSVVLAQTSPAFGRPDGDWQKSFINARLGPLDRGETMASLAASLVDELTGEAPDPQGVALARECMAAVPDATYRAMMLALMGFDLRSALPRIGVPALVLSGSRDNNAPAPMMAKMATHIPSATYVELEGAGHLANLENPVAFNAALEGFLRTNPATSRPGR